MSKRRLRRFAFLLCGMVAFGYFSGWRVYRHYRPAGATWYPPIFMSFCSPVDGRVCRSPNGRTVKIVFHDGGATHSGNFWTWLVVDNWLTGKRVVTEGFSVPDVRYGNVTFPLQWNEDGSATVRFATDRHGRVETLRTVRP